MTPWGRRSSYRGARSFCGEAKAKHERPPRRCTPPGVAAWWLSVPVVLFMSSPLFAKMRAPMVAHPGRATQKPGSMEPAEGTTEAGRIVSGDSTYGRWSPSTSDTAGRPEKP